MNVGDKVSWTHVSGGKRTVSMRRRDGVLVSIEGEIGTVKVSSGRTVQVPLTQLRTPEAKSALTEFVEAVRDVSRLNA